MNDLFHKILNKSLNYIHKIFVIFKKIISKIILKKNLKII